MSDLITFRLSANHARALVALGTDHTAPALARAAALLAGLSGETARRLADLLTAQFAGGTLPAHLLSSLQRFGAGYLLAVAVGVPLVLFVMFEIWFLVPLPKGPLERLLGF